MTSESTARLAHRSYILTFHHLLKHWRRAPRLVSVIGDRHADRRLWMVLVDCEGVRVSECQSVRTPVTECRDSCERQQRPTLGVTLPERITEFFYYPNTGTVHN